MGEGSKRRQLAWFETLCETRREEVSRGGSFPLSPKGGGVVFSAHSQEVEWPVCKASIAAAAVGSSQDRCM